MEDRDFIDFKFGDHWASDFNLSAVSSGDRYSPPVYGSVNPNTATIAGKVGVYKWKTQVNEKVFNIKIAFDNINGQILNQIKEWLNPFKIDKLVFKEEPYKYYWVALNTEPKLDFLPFLEETKVVNGIAFKEGVYKGEFELQFVCFDNYGYSDWQSFDENYDYTIKEIEGEESISFSDGSDNNLIITKVEGNSKQNVIEGSDGKTLSGSFISINDAFSESANVVIDGSSKQQTYEGYNLLKLDFDVAKEYVTVNNDGSFNVNNNSETNKYPTIKNIELKAGTYTFLYEKSSNMPTIFIQRNNDGAYNFYLSNDVKYKQFTFDEDGVFRFEMAFNAGEQKENIKLMLLSGAYTFDNQPNYEPYVGGIASPNPEYPQEVEVITECSLKQSGKNFLGKDFDFSTSPTNYGWDYVYGNQYKSHSFEENNILKLTTESTVTGGSLMYFLRGVSKLREKGLKKNTSYTFSIEIKGDLISSNPNHSFNDISLIYNQITLAGDGWYKEGNVRGTINYTNIINSTEWNKISCTINLPNNDDEIYFWIRFSCNGGTVYFRNMQIEEGAEVSSYEPYHEPKIYPINLNGNTLAKVGDIKDLLKIYRNGSVEIEKKNSKYTLTNSQINKGYYRIGTNANVYNIPLSIKGQTGSASCLTKHFKYTYNQKMQFGETATSATNNTFLWGSSSLTIRHDKFTTKEEYVEYLLENGFEFYYRLTTPQIIQLAKIEPIELWEGINKFELITNLDTNMSFNYNYVIPSPSPEIPSEVKTVGQNGSVEINICNDNLLPNDTQDPTNYTWENLSLPAGDYTLYFNCNITNSTSQNGLNIRVKYEEETSEEEIFNNKTTGWNNPKEGYNCCTFRLEKNISYFRINGYNANYSKFMLVRGKLAEENKWNTSDISMYIERQSQTKILPIQQEMLEGDYIDNKEYHTWGKIVLTGDENFTFDTVENKFAIYTLNISIDDNKARLTKCTHYSKYNEYGNTKNSFGIGHTFLRFYNDLNFSSVDEWKNYLKQQYNAGTPVTIYYKLKTPIALELTEEQILILNQLENELYSYEGTNYVFSTNETSPYLSISYIPKQDIYIDYVVNQSNLLNDSAFYYNNDIYKKSYFDAETGDATKSGISEDRPVYLYNAGTTAANLNLTFDMIIPAEGSPLVINTESCKLTDNGIQVLKQISSISISDFSKYKPFLEIYDGTPSNWQIQIDSNLCEVYLKHKTDETKIISLNKFNDNQSFLLLANCNFVDYSKPFPTLITAISGTALENTIFNKLSIGSSAQNYRLKNVDVEWKHTYL